MDNSNDDLYPLALLMDELKHDDVANRVDAMKKLDTIAIALGPERTVNELLPFLNEVAQDDEEEVFAVLGSKLGEFVPLIGGPEHCEPLIRILLILASMEEPLVRDKAIDSLNHVSTEIPHDMLLRLYLPMIDSLSQGNWFSKKVASCGLFKSVLIKVDAATRRDLLNIYYKLASDDSPMVRRGAASHLPTLIDKLTWFTENYPNSEDKVDNKDWEIISQIFQHLINDEQDSVKFLSVDVLVAILEFFQSVNDSSHNSEFLISSLKLIGDESWRVRYTAADRFSKVAKNFSKNFADLSKLIDPFISLMNDNEGEVRKAICKQLPEFCEYLGEYAGNKDVILEKIVPIIDKLSQDPHENVRASLALSVTHLSPVLGKQSTIDNLLPIFLVMLKDEFPEVRLNIISNLSIVNEIIGINLLSVNLLPAITELAQDGKWRVRLAIIEYIPKLAKQLGESFFNDELLSLCLSWLWDPVFAIRDAAVNILRELTEIFGSDWANKEIISRLLNNENENKNAEGDGVTENSKIDYSNFITRITCLFTITNLVPVVDVHTVENKLLPFVNSFADDPVPNIRFNIAKAYLVIAKALVEAKDTLPNSVSLIEQILSKLGKLSKDEDFDVRYYSDQSIEEIKKLTG
ncbi:Piso0_002566 [Millerozyma farinosa CBS 7064]|uniref:Piso0_002566 protein n=1 Tax=Pichia sorbitophila (strain ATCC MYA-4447 / BCRC 22081 / CBS 7064 / NBRC 10061 / NRRL Y-12695) TaxID=559304 RepID=G8YCY5_PICSO|nr:Piso0_002566 [Millerozyma farinosa CBS 7064]